MANVTITTSSKNFLLQHNGSRWVTKGDTVFYVGRDRHVITAGTPVEDISDAVTLGVFVQRYAQAKGLLNDKKPFWKVW